MASTMARSWIAQRLRDMAQLLEAQGGNPYRAAAYRNAADTVARLTRELREILAEEGATEIDALPGIGPRITAAITEMLATGAWGQLQRLRGEADPQTLLRTVPGIGNGLANRLHEALGVETLEALELAAHDGRLERVPHVGARRAAAIRAALGQMLDRVRASRRVAGPAIAGARPSRAAGGVAARRRPRIPQRGAGRDAGEDRAAALQPPWRGLAAGAAHPARRLAIHGAVLKHRPRARTRS
jgi:Holliday junction resolvasome RuvABC DNA-binding subunit